MRITSCLVFLVVLGLTFLYSAFYIFWTGIPFSGEMGPVEFDGVIFLWNLYPILCVLFIIVYTLIRESTRVCCWAFLSIKVSTFMNGVASERRLMYIYICIQ